MTGNATSDFRIKLLVVHPDGRRQKFLVTFPERKSLKIDQRYIGLPLTLRVEFPPGAIVCRPGTGHTLSVANKPVKEHVLAVNDTIGLDQYSIEFLELPEPLPMDEATRFVSISDVGEGYTEATIVVSSPVETVESTPAPARPTSPAIPHAQAPQIPRPPTPRHDPEDSTAIIRRLQVPGAAANGNPYASLQPTIPSRAEQRLDNTASGVRPPPDMYGQSVGEGSGLMTPPAAVRFNKKHLAIAGAALAIVALYLIVGKVLPRHESEDSTELASKGMSNGAPSPEQIVEAPPDTHPGTTEKAPAAAPAEPSQAALPVVPAPQAVVQVPPPVSMGGQNQPVGSPLDEKSDFDAMAVDQFFDAVDAGDESRIKELLEKRIVDINLTRRRGFAALHLSAARGDLATVKYLVKMKADVNVLDGSGATPLMWSVFRRHEDVVRFLAPKTNLKIERQGGETAYALAKRTNMRKMLSLLDPDPKKSKNRKRVPSGLPEKKKR